MCVIPQAGILANNQLKDRMVQEGYYEVLHTPGLWKHYSRKTSFTLLVDNFVIKHQCKENINHII